MKKYTVRITLHSTGKYIYTEVKSLSMIGALGQVLSGEFRYDMIGLEIINPDPLLPPSGAHIPGPDPSYIPANAN